MSKTTIIHHIKGHVIGDTSRFFSVSRTKEIDDDESLVYPDDDIDLDLGELFLGTRDVVTTSWITPA